MILEYQPHLTAEAIPAFTKDILKQLEGVCANPDTLFDIRLSLEEALINAVKHGNKLDQSKKVLVRIEAVPEKVVIEVKDEGSGFDYRSIASPTSDENVLKLSGRGVFLIRNFMDEVSFLDKGSRVKMIKYLKKEVK